MGDITDFWTLHAVIFKRQHEKSRKLQGQKKLQPRNLGEWKIDNLRDDAGFFLADDPDPRANRIEPAFHKRERDLAIAAARRTRHPTDFFRIGLGKQSRTWNQRKVLRRNQAEQLFVSLSRHFHSRDRFLSDVAAFFVIDAARFQVRFNGNYVVGQLAAPTRNPLLDAKNFRANFVAIGQRLGKFRGDFVMFGRIDPKIVTIRAEPIDQKNARGGGNVRNRLSDDVKDRKL